MSDEIFCQLSVDAINKALKQSDSATVQKAIEKLEIAGLKEEAENIRKVCGPESFSPRHHGHMSKASRKAIKSDEKYKGQKIKPLMARNNAEQRLKHSDRIPLEMLLGYPRTYKKCRLSEPSALRHEELIIHPNCPRSRMLERLPSVEIKLHRHLERYQLIVPPDGGHPRLFEKLPSVEMKCHRHLEKYQLVVSPDGGNPRLFEKFPSVEMKLHRHLENYQLIVPADGGHPRLFEKLPSVEMLRHRDRELLLWKLDADPDLKLQEWNPWLFR
uniref:Uncharacterized protein n=2 Tax=Aplanochytrium stocchinoi TaxID=215587 RepID=A0A7S3PEY0_9STRA